MDHPKDHPLDSHEKMQLQESFRALKGHIKGRFQWIAIAQLFLVRCCMKISMEKPSHSKMYLPVRHGDFRFAMLVFGRVYSLAPCVNTGKSMDSEG